MPNVLAVLILQQTDCLYGRVIQQPHSVLAVRRTQAVVQLDDLISGDGSSGSGSNTDLCTFVIVEQTGGLTVAVTGNECFFFCLTDTLGKHIQNILFQIHTVVLQHLIGCTDGSDQLIGIQNHLAEFSIQKGNCSILGDPVGGIHIICDGNMGAMGGSDDLADLTKYISVGQGLDHAVMVSIRHQITAGAITAFLQGVVGHTGVHGVPEGFVVSLCLANCGSGTLGLLFGDGFCDGIQTGHQFVVSSLITHCFTSKV